MIEREDLGAGVAEPSSRDQPQRGGFPCPGRSDDQRMAEILNMQDEVKRRRTAECGKQQRRTNASASRCSHFPKPGPDRRDREHVGQVHRAQQHATMLLYLCPAATHAMLDGVEIQRGMRTQDWTVSITSRVLS